jgi:hypothetical protein
MDRYLCCRPRWPSSRRSCSPRDVVRQKSLQLVNHHLRVSLQAADFVEEQRPDPMRVHAFV